MIGVILFWVFLANADSVPTPAVGRVLGLTVLSGGDGSEDMRFLKVTLFFKGILLVVFKIFFLAGAGIFGGNLMFKGRFNFNVDLGIPVGDFSTVFDTVLNCGCL